MIESQRMKKQQPMSPEEFQECLMISKENMERLTLFVRTLEKWSNRINLVSAASLIDVWRRHILDSAQLLSLIPKKTETILDIGSGAGFPGLVLAILGDCQVHLVESDQRKSAFLNEVNRLTASNVRIHNCRIEELQNIKTDIVTVRACASVKKLLQYAAPIMKKEGKCIFLKGVKAEDELTESKKNWTMKSQSIPSISDPSGVILILENISYSHG